MLSHLISESNFIRFHLIEFKLKLVFFVLQCCFDHNSAFKFNFDLHSIKLNLIAFGFSYQIWSNAMELNLNWN